MSKLIVLSTQRSGSTMVCDDLTGTNRLGRPSEYFIKVIKGIGKCSPEQLRSLIYESLEKGETSNGILGLKIMANQILPIGKALSLSELCNDESNERCFYSFFKDAVFIRVIREDKIAQAVSRVIARQTGVYHVADTITGLEGMLGKISKKRDEKLLTYDYEAILKEVKNIKEEEDYLDRFFCIYNLTPLPIVYEKAIEDRTYVEKLAISLGVGSVKIINRRLKKASVVISQNWVRQFRRTYNTEDIG